MIEFEPEIILKILLACGLGTLIGIEREFGKEVEKKVLTIGLRTSILLCMLGFLFGYVYLLLDNIFILLFGIGIASAIGLSGYFARLKVYNLIGMTTLVSAIIIFMIGVLISLDRIFIGIVVAILTAAFLAYRRELHEKVKALEKKEIEGAIKFGIIALVILPILPNKFVDPLNVFNPFVFWTYVIMISGILFITYIALRLYAEKGLLLSSFLSGIISSTLTSLIVVKSLRENKKLADAVPDAITISIIGGMLSYIIISLIILKDITILKYIAIPIIATIVFGIFLSRDLNKIKKHKINPGSPFALKSAVQFAAIYLIVIILVTLAQEHLGSLGSILVVAVGSLGPVSGIIAGIASLAATGQMSLAFASQLILVSVFMNIVNKFLWVRVPGKISKQISKKLIILAIFFAAAAIAQICLVNPII